MTRDKTTEPLVRGVFDRRLEHIDAQLVCTSSTKKHSNSNEHEGLDRLLN